MLSTLQQHQDGSLYLMGKMRTQYGSDQTDASIHQEDRVVTHALHVRHCVTLSRTLDHACNIDIDELSSKISTASMLNAAFQQHPDVAELGPTRTKETKMVLPGMTPYGQG